MDSIDHCVQDDDYNDLSNHEPMLPEERRNQMEFKEWWKEKSKEYEWEQFSGLVMSYIRTAWNEASRTDQEKRQLKEQLEKCKCCGNCKYWRVDEVEYGVNDFTYCGRENGDRTNGKDICPEWEART